MNKDLFYYSIAEIGISIIIGISILFFTYKIIEKLVNYDNISMITFTTGDYMNYTRNLIESIKKCGLMKKLKIYCIDEKAFDFLKQYKKQIYLFIIHQVDYNHKQFLHL